MPFAFQKIQLEADSLFALINTWAEMQLLVEEAAASIIGFGYTDEIGEAFTMLVFDWEATIFLKRIPADIPVGAYDLIRDGDLLYACKGQRSYSLEDQAVVVEVISVPEN